MGKELGGRDVLCLPFLKLFDQFMQTDGCGFHLFAVFKARAAMAVKSH
jgi:hypothetical protein